MFWCVAQGEKKFFFLCLYQYEINFKNVKKVCTEQVICNYNDVSLIFLPLTVRTFQYPCRGDERI
jgi:hypothetical protein